MVGSVIAWDLKRMGFDVTVADVRAEALERVASRADVRTVRADLSDAAVLKKTVDSFDLVVAALSSHMGFASLRAILEAGKNCVDISFMAENAWDLDDLAKSRGVTAIVDCGVGPGMSNIIAGYATTVLSPCERIDIKVGGLPVVRTWPFEYKAPFAPSDVLEEYVRPARIVEASKIVERPALSEPELVDFEGVGTLEAFNTDGLRSLAYFLDVPNMREKTMRYPGHIGLMRILRETGFFSSEPIEVDGAKVSPIALTSKLLFPKWSFAEGEEDITVMRIVAEGRAGGDRVRRTWELFDRYDPATGFRSMSRTTGFPATIAAELVAQGKAGGPGVHPPEVLGKMPGMLQHFIAGLADRGVRFTERTEVLR
ncbi:MAG: saccharopine dehydrogenase [Polyangiaceae bacterium]|nr:saccharopine dehydrogenase [Polyangiaceae bacterium]